MNTRGLRKFAAAAVLIAGVIAAWQFIRGRQDDSVPTERHLSAQPAPVEVAPVEHGPVELRRTFSGALEAPTQFVVAPKVAGRVERLSVNIADPVTRGQVVAQLDDDEYVQAVAQARAELAVAGANRVEAKSALQIAERDLERVTRLRKRGVASEADLDAARADQLAKKARLAVARAQVTRAEAALETARIRRGYTRITADWSGGDERRVVAERFVDEGETISANTPLLRIVELDPISAVIYVTEKDYGRLQPGLEVALTTDAYPRETFAGRIERIAPVFRQETRQARVELAVANPERHLKPGMFVRATVVLERVADAVVVPEQALTTRGDRTGLFLLAPDEKHVVWREVRVGIRQEGRVQVLGEGLAGRAVTLGQQLLDDGSAVTVPADQRPAADDREAGRP
jgi:RND family efflux transporter MFP subunit